MLLSKLWYALQDDNGDDREGCEVARIWQVIEDNGVKQWVHVGERQRGSGENAGCEKAATLNKP